MKKLLALAAPAALFAAVVSSHASADPQLVQVAQPLRFFATAVTGTIHVPGAQTGALAGLSCANITVGAQSQATNPPPAGGIFSSPKWTRSTTATGNYASGACTYTMFVPGNSAFFLTTGGHGNFNCDVVAPLTTPSSIGPISVPFGTKKTEDFKITSFLCEVIH